MFRAPGIPYEDNHGQLLDWIASGGGFTIGNIQEPTSAYLAIPRVLFKAFLVNGFTWGEAALASLPKLGHHQTPIGDPLARIEAAYDPDITGPESEPDRKVDTLDRNLVAQQLGQSGTGLQADINQDGTENTLDQRLVMEAFGRNCETPPIGEIECGQTITCGDLNFDGFVNADDLAIFDAYVISVGGYQPCPLMENWTAECTYDFNLDCELDAGDRAVIESHDGLCFDYDLTNNGVVDFFDYICFIHHYDGLHVGDPGYEPQLDYNCDGMIDIYEQSELQNHFDEPAMCQSPTQQAICGAQ
jgi:hypothetical protein